MGVGARRVEQEPALFDAKRWRSQLFTGRKPGGVRIGAVGRDGSMGVQAGWHGMCPDDLHEALLRFSAVVPRRALDRI